jgi:hypothetical protein
MIMKFKVKELKRFNSIYIILRLENLDKMNFKKFNNTYSVLKSYF